jgi:preprotein translocase subunit SecG
LLIILILDAFVLVAAVLLQAGTGGGLAAMGGGASTDTFMGGRQAATILTRGTWWLGGIFLGLALVLAGMSTRTAVPRSVLDTQQQMAPAPIAPPPQLPLDVEPQSQQAPAQDPN